MNWFDMSGEWLAAFAAWLGVLVQWLTINFPQLLASLQSAPGPASPGAGLPGTNVSATPELDSLVLFGTGLAGMGSVALTRIRTRRRT
jgi:hypothetical protein